MSRADGTQWLGAPELRDLASALDLLDQANEENSVTLAGDLGLPSAGDSSSGITLPVRYGSTDTDDDTERHRVGVQAGLGDLGPVTRG